MTRDPFSEDPLIVPEDVIGLYVNSQDTDFPPSNEKLSQQVVQLESEVDEKDKIISRFKGTVNEMVDVVVQIERHARRHQTKLEDQTRQNQKELERVTVLTV